MRRPAWPLLLLLCCFLPLHAQQPVSAGIIDGRLHRIDGGYIGIARYGSVGVLTLYNDSLIDRVTLPYQDLTPIDLAIPAPASSHGYLLGTHDGRRTLYRIALRDRPEITPVWESDFSPFSRIITARDLNGDGDTEIAMLADDAFAVVGDGGEERYRLEGNILGGVFRGSDSLRFFLAMRSGEGIRILQIDAATGSATAMQEIPDAHELMMDLLPGPSGDVLVVAALGRDPAAYVFDPAGLFPPDRFPLPISPLALIPYDAGDRTVPAALFGGYPGPAILPLLPDAPVIHVEYPLSGVTLGAATAGTFNILLARDSLVLYDRSMRLYGMLPSVGSSGVRVTAAGVGWLLIASDAGSRVVAVPQTGMPWIERHWPLVLASMLGGIIILVTLMASRRYSFIRTIYNNLVRVPGSYGIIVMTPRQRVRQINQSARGMLEIAPYIPYGRHISEYLVAEEMRPVLQPLRLLLTDGESFEQHVDVEREGSSRTLIFRGRPLVGAYGRTKGYLLLVEDVTRRLERERLINWASVAHHIAHEMKTPLGTVRMTAEMLHDRLESNGTDGEHTRATARIIRQSARLREIVDDLLTIARTEALQKVGTDLALLFSSLVHDFSDTLDGAIELRFEVDGENFRTHTDVGQLTVAMRNLLDNAAQAIGSREGGLIRLALKEEEEHFLIVVEDNGIGMSRETLANLFKPFYTERPGGSGIGTVIIKRVIEGHGGSIRVESERGRGTRFVVNLPR